MRRKSRLNNLEILSLLIIQVIVYSSSIAELPVYIESLKISLLTYLTKYYVVLGYLILIAIIIISLVKPTKLSDDKPEYSLPSWLGMIFTSTLAADIMYYSLIDWTNYITITKDTYINSQFTYELSLVYPLLHWGVSAWGFYLVPAVVYSYIMYHKKQACDNYSEALSIHKSSNLSLAVNTIGVIVLILAVATTYSIATPLSSVLLSSVFNIADTQMVTIYLIAIIGIIYSAIAYSGKLSIIKNVSNVTCILYLLILGIVLSQSNLSLVLSVAYNSISYLISNFVGLTLFTSTTSFTRDYTVFYWSYWIAWSVANPFFIAKISKGRTMREIVLLGTLSSVLGTYVSFIIMSGYTLTCYQSGVNNIDNTYQFVLSCINSTNYSLILTILIPVCMILLYITTLDSLTYTLCNYCKSSKVMKIVWSLVLINTPIWLIYNNYSLDVLQSIDIILALPISIILIALCIKFYKMIKSERIDD